MIRRACEALKRWTGWGASARELEAMRELAAGYQREVVALRRTVTLLETQNAQAHHEVVALTRENDRLMAEHTTVRPSLQRSKRKKASR